MSVIFKKGAGNVGPLNSPAPEGEQS